MTANDPLPDLSAPSLDRIEDSVFARIGDERARRRTRRARWWAGGTAAVAAIVVAAVVGPAVVTATAPSTGGGAVIAGEAMERVEGDDADHSAGEEFESGVGAADAATSQIIGEPDREVVASASATLDVEDAVVAAEAIAERARTRDGWVESAAITREHSGDATVDPATSEIVDTSFPVPYAAGSWITVRVPAAQLDAMVADLSEIGEVRSTSIDSYDVTEQTVDLRARIDATEASVERLSELLDEAGDLSDLIAAEAALAERQAILESYRAQLEDLETRVATSSLTVTLVEPAEQVTADPAGFGDGLAAGWNGLVATLNGIVVGLGFLVPWLLVIGVAVGVVWLVLALVRRHRGTAAGTSEVEGTENGGAEGADDSRES
ncbi:DUF4349 domain-containing protein [Microbacterium sp. SSW1-59]|uniref:DUF4349 domain-containing protein n=1 Tax=Microbacterium xanthum TaxID=3079794 RepID=UPI002AD497A3|nr:DUF4349 domain-containing protein [Microbacterium sp. SSW1-59]MDZ8201985.1 DUF4349 domain-containing protein [Microbacterium sp. SSW1-59]